MVLAICSIRCINSGSVIDVSIVCAGEHKVRPYIHKQLNESTSEGLTTE